MKESSRVLEHNDIFTLDKRSFRYEFTPEMIARHQFLSSQNQVTGTIPLTMETPKKPSSLSASVFSISELPSSPATPKTPIPASRPASASVSNGQSPKVAASPMGVTVVDSEISTSPKLSPKVVRIADNESLAGVTPFNIVGASSLGTSVVSSTDHHGECDKENICEASNVEVETVKASDNEPISSESAEVVCDAEVTEGTCASEPVFAAEATEDVCAPETVECAEVEMKDSAIEEATEVTDTVMEASTKAAEVAETVVDESNEIVDSVMEESTEIVVSEPVMEQATESEVVESAMEESSEAEVVNSAETIVSEPVMETSAESVMQHATESEVVESAMEEVTATAMDCENAQASEEVVEEHVPVATETTAIDMICESKVIESAEVSVSEEAVESTEACEMTEAVTEAETAELADEIMPSQYESVSHTFPERETFESVEMPLTQEHVYVHTESETVVALVEKDMESENTLPVESEKTTEVEAEVADTATPPMSTNSSFYHAYETSCSDANNSAPMESVEVSQVVFEQQNDTIEAPGPVVEAEPKEDIDAKEGETAVGNVVETPETTAESAIMPSAESEPTEAPEVAKPEVETTAEVTEPVETVEAPATEPSTESPVTEPAEDNLEVAIEAPEVENESFSVVIEGAEISSVEIESIGVVSKPASPKRGAEDQEVESSTPGPIRKSTRVHLTPAALESVKKQHGTQSESPLKVRSGLRSSSRQTRSTRAAAAAEPTSPKGRTQKRATESNDENENNLCLSDAN